MLKLFFPLVLAASSGLSDVSPNDFLAVEMQLAAQKGFFEISNNQFEKDKKVTRADFEKAISAIKCADLQSEILAEKPRTHWVRKSEAVQEISQIIGDQVSLPAGWRAAGFLDLEETQPHFEPAQKLVSLGILDRNGGYFGTSAEKNGGWPNPDPEITRQDFLVLLSRSFEMDKCGAQFRADLDGDGVENSADLCRKIPGSATTNGCPNIGFLQNSSEIAHSGVKVFQVKNNPELEFVEKSEIRPGDRFFAFISGLADTSKIPDEAGFLVEE